ncbi:MAG: hypothetical protein G01um101419_657 [Parcubacteria group bacterium Gr01-1014_19]|nr:MAG: hypothetical protein G01um101419_657 [Parcubacteria group bacterium Gr01-1014_19]
MYGTNRSRGGMADTYASGAYGRKAVEVQVLSRALWENNPALGRRALKSRIQKNNKINDKSSNNPASESGSA